MLVFRERDLALKTLLPARAEANTQDPEYLEVKLYLEKDRATPETKHVEALFRIDEFLTNEDDTVEADQSKVHPFRPPPAPRRPLPCILKEKTAWPGEDADVSCVRAVPCVRAVFFVLRRQAVEAKAKPDSKEAKEKEGADADMQEQHDLPPEEHACELCHVAGFPRGCGTMLGPFQDLPNRNGDDV